jgi:hypothetical protein
MVNYIVVFFVVAIGDVFWTLLMQAVAKNRGHDAGLHSVCIIVASVYLARAYNHDGWLVIPAALGAYAGTRFPIEFKKLLKQYETASERDRLPHPHW